VLDADGQADQSVGDAALGLARATHLLRSLLHGVSPLDPLTFIRVPVVLAAVGLLASWLPARRAPVRVDPMFALRQE
jgi:ABC-type lipoprotein release transport system permease subunit